MLRTGTALIVLLATAGCGPKLVRESVFQSEAATVQLRRMVSDGKPVARGRAQPAVIASVRLAHILASLSHEDSKGERSPTIRSEHVYELGEGMAKAFEKAGPDDEVVAIAYGRDRRLAIFTVDRVTAFRSFLEADGSLVIDFFAIEQEVSDPARGRPASAWEPPSEPPRERPPFKLIPGDAQRAHGARGLEIDWRDDLFRQPIALRIRGGRVHRRKVLLEAPVESIPPAAAAPLPENLSDAQRSALDQLEAARREGLVRETEYQRRRILILGGQLEEAGYPVGTP